MTPTPLADGKKADPRQALREAWGRQLQSILDEAQPKPITQAELAERLEAAGHPVTIQAVSQWCTGRTAPLPHHQVAIARALNVPHRLIFAITDEVA